MIGAFFRELFGRATPADLRSRAGRLRDASFVHLERSKARRDEARALDELADDLEFGPRARLPRAHAPHLGEGDTRNARPP